MSDHWICMIPRMPDYIPADEAFDEAARYLRTIAPDAEDITCEVSTVVELHDCGANLETIRCPSCASELSVEWWADQVQGAGDHGIELRPISLPCGHVAPSLNDLVYHFDLGFSRFKLQAMNANVGSLNPEPFKRFESILGCPLKAIYRHI